MPHEFLLVDLFYILQTLVSVDSSSVLLASNFNSFYSNPFVSSYESIGAPKSGGSQFFLNVANNNFLDWFDPSSESAHPVFGKVRSCSYSCSCPVRSDFSRMSSCVGNATLFHSHPGPCFSLFLSFRLSYFLFCLYDNFIIRNRLSKGWIS